jgi:tetratricopeptide (TPR) repeat protein
MRIIKRAVLVIFLAALAAVAMAQSMESSLTDKRLTVHTLVREDIFAGFLADDMERFTRGEKNIDLLLEKRPNEKADLLAWKGGAALYRAVRAYESKNNDEFKKYYQQALDYFAQAKQINPMSGGAIAVSGGSQLILGDRLPQEYRAAAWSQAYAGYQMLLKGQESMVDRLPLHLKGELLGGLAMSAQRTGHAEEAAQYVDKIIASMPNTPYEKAAKQWKANPQAAATTSITCLSCHDQGRLSARLSAINK